MKALLVSIFLISSVSAFSQGRDFSRVAIDAVNSHCNAHVDMNDYSKMKSIEDGSNDYAVHAVFFTGNRAVTIEEKRLNNTTFLFNVLRVYCGK